MPHVVYHRNYNIGFYGLERLHPFDSRKYGKAWKRLNRLYLDIDDVVDAAAEIGTEPNWENFVSQAPQSVWRSIRHHIFRHRPVPRARPKQPVSDADLQLVHSRDYLDSLRDPNVAAAAIEIPILRRAPCSLVDRHILRPMRWATQGTILAAELALKNGFTVNLGGGFHHAKPDAGEGFSVYSDIGIAVASLRERGLLGETDRIVYIDTDAHQGNGVCHVFRDDPSVFIFDIYNSMIYPSYDLAAKDRVDCAIPIDSGITNKEYHDAIVEMLPGFLDSVGKQDVALAIYNAGTDTIDGDPLGGLRISSSEIVPRDNYILSALQCRKIPTLMVPSGGYTRRSFELIAASVNCRLACQKLLSR